MTIEELEKMTSHEIYELRYKIPNHTIVSDEITDEIRKKWFRDYGTMNGWGEKTSHEYAIASLIHAKDKYEHPELHKKLPQLHNWRCWQEDRCSCGLESSSDSSDCSFLFRSCKRMFIA